MSSEAVVSPSQPTPMSFAVDLCLPARQHAYRTEEYSMSVTYTFDIFSSLDGFGAAGVDWIGYWESKARTSRRPVRSTVAPKN